MDLARRLELRIPPDPTWWAKSVTWSCGRPEMPPIELNFDHEAAEERLRRQWRLAGYLGLMISAPNPRFRVTDIS